MHVRAVLAGARHVVQTDDVNEWQADNVLVEMARFFGIPAAPREVMQAEDGRRGFGHAMSP
jgi:hypothetical protein